jgi:hypothetical protein
MISCCDIWYKLIKKKEKSEEIKSKNSRTI